MQQEANEMSSEGARLVFWGFVLLTLLAVLGSFHLNKSTRYFAQHAKPANGVIVKNMPASNNNAGYDVWAEFSTEDGEQHTVHLDTKLKGPNARVGRKVEILYLPGDPDSAHLKEWINDPLRKYVPWVFVMGFLFFATLIGSGLAKREGASFLLFQKG
jgi:hypothetical protein